MEYEILKNSEGIIFKDLVLIKPKIFKDIRGYFMESWNKKELSEILKEDLDFCQIISLFSIRAF